MKRILHWLKGAWLWVFADVRTEMREQAVRDRRKKGDGE